MIGVSFGGISLDENGTIVKSKFWYYFGFCGCFFHFVIVGYLMQVLFLSSQTIDGLKISYNQIVCFHLAILKKFYNHFNINNQSKIWLQNHQHLFKYSFNHFNKLKLIQIIWIIHILSSLILFAVHLIKKT